jgi:hypothetical protein
VSLPFMASLFKEILALPYFSKKSSRHPWPQVCDYDKIIKVVVKQLSKLGLLIKNILDKRKRPINIIEPKTLTVKSEFPITANTTFLNIVVELNSPLFLLYSFLQGI